MRAVDPNNQAVKKSAICGIRTPFFVGIVVIVVAGAVVGALFGAGIIGSGLTAGRKSFKIDQIEPSTLLSRRNRLFKRAAASPADVIPSQTNYNYAEVVGIKLKITTVAITPAESGTEIASVQYSEDFEFGPDVATTPLAKSANIPNGEYTRIEMQTKNYYSLKAYCKTATKFVYTSPGSIKTIALSSFTNTLPNDFGYYEYAFAWPAIASSPSSRDQNTQSTSFEARDTFTVSDASTINILMDTAFTVSCFDGVAANQNDKISPFSGGPTNAGAPLTDYFPNNQPNFGLLRLPLFGYIGDDAASVTAQTYLFSESGANLNGSAIDPTKCGVMTLALKPNGDALGIRFRNSPSNGQLSDDAVVTKTGNGFEIKNGYYSTGAGRVVQNRKFTFTASQNKTDTRPFSGADGSDCGQAITDNVGGQTQNRSKPCLNSNFQVYFKRRA